ncbi:prolipoprotein diacylglyceryl transferase [Asticcacaulis biprosthecium C19]|uniref:Phosphatidylglycerol--prolipoprotein diacylglyceryl transferase n=1 Tax=Asticcacaulis biprosthecium C19 TaxID=715226 RepID=F4QSH0_9CAUL|nr:prolipoprotein diacylglyceryl transferase [Asticcacaulis biprosthecium]EGF89690.1 prolipoprotein diacylglyceryl transferase [Asticcacaulis biprosthecium C19]
MTLPDIDPVIFQLGPVAIRWYALAYIAGIVLGWLYLGRLIRNESLWTPRQPPVNTDQLDDLVVWMTLGIIIGGRIGFILFYDMSLIWRDFFQVFMIQNGGMSFHGGFVGVVAATVIYARVKKFDLPQLLNLGDLLACAAPIGLFFGRIANFINGELWGRETTAPWGIIFCNSHTCSGGQGIVRHPSQLYEAATEGLILFAVAWYLAHVRKEFKRPGLITGVFIAGYGIFRILIEMVREPDEQMWDFFKNVITMGQTLSLLMVIAGAAFIWHALRKDSPSTGKHVA